MPRVTYASTNDDLQYLERLGVPLDDIAGRMGRSPDAVYSMIQTNADGEGTPAWGQNQGF